VDSTGPRLTNRLLLRQASALSALAMLACGPSGHTVAPSPEPAAAPPAVVETIEEPLPASIDEAQALFQAGRRAEYERALMALASSADATTRQRAQTRLGLFLFDEKRYEDAIPALQKAAAEHGMVAPFLMLRVVEGQAQRGDYAAAIAAAESIIAASPRTSAATIARLRLPELQARAGDAAATNLAFDAIASVAIDELTEKDFADLATGLAAAGRLDLATRVRMRLLQDYPQGRFTEQTYREVANTPDSPLDTISLADSVRLAAGLSGADRFDQVLDLLQRTEKRFPGSGTNDEYRKVRLRALFRSRNYQQLIGETKPEQLDASQQLSRARAAWRAERPEEFLAGLDRVEKQFKGSREALEAKVLRAKYYVTDEVDYEKSIANLTAAIEGGAFGSEGENLWNLGWTHTLARHDDEALRLFDRYSKQFPDGDYKTNSLFWTAKIHERQGRTALRDAALQQILTEYPYSYYAYRAREILGLPTAAPHEVANGAVFPDLDSQLALVSDGRVDAVRELTAIGLSRDATREIKALSLEYPENSGVAFMLADVYSAGGEPFKANTTIQRRFRQFVRHGGTNIPARFWEILFPLNYWDTIRAEATRRGVDPYLLASIIRQESGFEPTVVSNAGAVGLMQIMPQEASVIAAAGGLEEMTRERLFDPQQNIAMGAAEYIQKLERVGGNPILAIAAYNAGEKAVGRWLAQTPIDDSDLFIESIPYAETRLYVKSVTRNRFEYRRIYESSNAAQQSSQ
jgi:soluble lytic murein transglycosylase-like protein